MTLELKKDYKKLKKSQINKFCVLVSLFSLISFTAKSHDYHVTIVDIHLNTEDSVLEIATKLFIDDLEYLFEKQGTFLYLDTDKEHEDSDSLISSILQKNISIQINSKPRAFQFYGKEYDNDVVWVYLTIKPQGEFNEISVKNTLFFNLFEDQSHLIHIEQNTNEATLVTNPHKPMAKTAFTKNK